MSGFVTNSHVEPVQTPVVEAQSVVGAPVIETPTVAKPVVLGGYYGGYDGYSMGGHYHHLHYHRDHH